MYEQICKVYGVTLLVWVTVFSHLLLYAKNCASKTYSTKKGTAVIRWLTRTIRGGLSFLNWPFTYVSKSYFSVYILTAKANSACSLREWGNEKLYALVSRHFYSPKITF